MDVAEVLLEMEGIVAEQNPISSSRRLNRAALVHQLTNFHQRVCAYIHRAPRIALPPAAPSPRGRTADRHTVDQALSTSWRMRRGRATPTRGKLAEHDFWRSLTRKCHAPTGRAHPHSVIPVTFGGFGRQHICIVSRCMMSRSVRVLNMRATKCAPGRSGLVAHLKG